MNSHPSYPIRHGVPAMDRCVCGGVRHWHGAAPYGCDDCESCTEFTLNEDWRPPVRSDLVSVERLVEVLELLDNTSTRVWKHDVIAAVSSLAGPEQAAEPCPKPKFHDFALAHPASLNENSRCPFCEMSLAPVTVNEPDEVEVGCWVIAEGIPGSPRRRVELVTMCALLSDGNPGFLSGIPWDYWPIETVRKVATGATS